MSDENLQQLSFIEQNLSSIAQQRQAFQKYVLEIDNALSELEKQKEAYEIVGSIMVKKDAKSLASSLEEKKKAHKSRVESLEKQEKTLRDKAKKLQEEVMSNLEKK